MALRLNKPREKTRTIETHEKHIAALLNSRRRVKTLLLGSSMFERFETTGKVHLADFRKRRVFVGGVGGDGVREILWRVDNGLLNGSFHGQRFNRIVLWAGGNDLERYPANEIAAGVKNLISVIRQRLARIDIVPEIFVCTMAHRVHSKAARKPKLAAKFRENIQLFNTLLRRMVAADNELKLIETKDVFDPNTHFVDHVHFNSEGYNVFHKLICESLDAA